MHWKADNRQHNLSHGITEDNSTSQPCLSGISKSVTICM